jgi:hypothetical protein
MACIMMTRIVCLGSDAITIGSHSRATRMQISDPDCPFWGLFLVPCSKARKNFFFTSSDYQRINISTKVLPVYHRPTTICLSRGGVLCTFGLFSCRGHPAALSSPRLISCQLLCILTPHRLGSAIGRPRRLVTHVPSFPPAKQHHARHAESES